MTLIVDAGGLLSVFDGDQDDHDLFLEAVQAATGPLVVSPIVLAELDHFILDRLGRRQELADLTTFDLAYASCVVLAEHYECFDILTTDQRDFRAVTGRDGQYFRVLPYDR